MRDQLLEQINNLDYLGIRISYDDSKTESENLRFIIDVMETCEEIALMQMGQ